jgi:hypothetical protein
MTFLDSLNSFEAQVQNFFVETEADVQAVIANIQKEVQIGEAALDQALKWVAANTPAIVADIEGAISFATAVGAAANPAAAAVIAAAQTAVTALNAVATAQNTGATDVQTLLAGYTAVKQAQAAAASTAAAATNAVASTTPPAAAPAAS